jgi:glycosyltransferase involved in cell wall biosynthesis
MKFSIITPTYKNKDALHKAVLSLIAQTHKDWEMIIINDSPQDRTYDSFITTINDSRIQYRVNPYTRGFNYCKNIALDTLSADSKWVIFLDEDARLSPDTLTTFHDLVLEHQDVRWFTTNHAYSNGISITHYPRNESRYAYTWSNLILRRAKGTATHCIETKLITQNHLRFSSYIHQGEEWFLYYQVGLHTPLFYYDHNSTIYSQKEKRITFQNPQKNSYLETTAQLFYEGAMKKILFHPAFIIYTLFRYF